VLRQYAEVADEIVCAVDARVPEAELEELEGHTDVLVRCDVSPATGMERNLAWLYGLCRGDWILRVDSDEAASPGFLACLRELILAEDVLQFIFPCRWLFPDGQHWLNEEPWSLDRHLRLVRNVPPLLRFEGVQHTEVELVYPHRYVDRHFYHLDCILSSTEYRAAKGERYENYRPGVLTEQGHPVNNFYLPERHQREPSVPVPAEDQPLIDEVLAAVDPPGKPGTRRWRGGGVPYVRQEEIDRTWAHRAVPASAYRATWLCHPEVHDMVVGGLRSIFVVLRNDGTERWPWGNFRPEIRLASRWLSADGSEMLFNSIRTPFTADVAPGATVHQPMTLEGPPEPGAYVLELDIVHEHVRWFGCPLHIPMTVRPAP